MREVVDYVAFIKGSDENRNKFISRLEDVDGFKEVENITDEIDGILKGYSALADMISAAPRGVIQSITSCTKGIDITVSLYLTDRGPAWVEEPFKRRVVIRGGIVKNTEFLNIDTKDTVYPEFKETDFKF